MAMHRCVSGVMLPLVGRMAVMMDAHVVDVALLVLAVPGLRVVGHVLPSSGYGGSIEGPGMRSKFCHVTSPVQVSIGH